MRRRSPKEHRSGCPIGIGLDLVGDPWSLLIVRDLMFKNRKSYNDFLGAEEGIATNVLADRLARLESHGIVEKLRNPTDGRRFIYRLTAKGIGLAPTVIEMILWVASYEKTDAPPEVLEAMRNNRKAVLDQVRNAWQKSLTENAAV